MRRGWVGHKRDSIVDWRPMNRWFGKLAVAWLVIASSAAAQDLAPETVLLARIKSHMREEFSHVTNYTCLETTARFHAAPGPQAKAQLKLAPLDTVRLEIVYANHHEWY